MEKIMFWDKKMPVETAERLKIAEKMAKQMDALTEAMRADAENTIAFEADDEGDLWRNIVARCLSNSRSGDTPNSAAKKADQAIVEYRKRLVNSSKLNR